ncbi:MAG TPA: outer-membrane lipoprotein carrier protein LolA [Candidatus Kapabacteria bacterium]|nr:outer-membrane lipoprotein carrier protein LolA [Candidatus Kapabacteria bacterium]
MKSNIFRYSRIVLSLFSILFLLQSSSLLSQNKEQFYNELKTKLTGLKSISFEFAALDGSNLNGKITATKDKYKMILPGRIIISNSKTVWNYSPEQAKVLISTIADINSASIHNIFFQIVENYEPSSLKVATKSTGAKYYELELKSNQNPDDYITLNLNYKTKNIEAVNFSINGQSANLAIKNLLFNPKVKDNQFEFKPPKGTQVIDLR